MLHLDNGPPTKDLIKKQLLDFAILVLSQKKESAILVVTWNLVYIKYCCTILKTVTWLCCRCNCRDKGIIDEDCKRQIIASHICSNLIQKRKRKEI